MCEVRLHQLRVRGGKEVAVEFARFVPTRLELEAVQLDQYALAHVQRLTCEESVSAKLAGRWRGACDVCPRVSL